MTVLKHRVAQRYHNLISGAVSRTDYAYFNKPGLYRKVEVYDFSRRITTGYLRDDEIQEGVQNLAKARTENTKWLNLYKEALKTHTGKVWEDWVRRLGDKAAEHLQEAIDKGEKLDKAKNLNELNEGTIPANRPAAHDNKLMFLSQDLFRAPLYTFAIGRASIANRVSSEFFLKLENMGVTIEGHEGKAKVAEHTKKFEAFMKRRSEAFKLKMQDLATNEMKKAVEEASKKFPEADLNMIKSWVFQCTVTKSDLGL
jgi:hypothetical protein